MDTESDSRGAAEDGATSTGSGIRRSSLALADPPLTDPASLDLRPPSPWRRFAPGGPDGSARLISVVVLAVLVVVCLVLAVLGVVKATENASQAARAAAAYTPPPPSAAAAATSVVTVIGDAASGASTSSSAWPALLAKQLKVTVLPSAVAGEGWIAKGKGKGGATFVTDAAKVSPTSTVVVFFGGASDQSETALAVVQAEGKAIAAVRTQAPRAKIVVVGPVSTAAKPPQPLLRVRDAERTAAQAAKVRFVDPIAAKWFSGQSGVVGSDGAPTDKGQKLIEAALAAVIQPLA
jgi:acyl-CoA thioesterase I